MAALVSLRAVADEMDLLGDETHAFLNRQTGELYSTTSELLERAEEGDDDDLLGWETEIIAKLREVLGSPDWLNLPGRDTRDDYRIMERFCLERTEGDLQDELLRAIDGRGAFRWFRDVIHRRDGLGIGNRQKPTPIADLPYRSSSSLLRQWSRKAPSRMMSRGGPIERVDPRPASPEV
jgi:hypothetical protein